MKILIGTKNPGKIEGARQAFEKYFDNVEIEGISVNSDVGDQPVNEEILQGAKNRVKNLKKYAKENNIIMKYEQLKIYIKEFQKSAREKYSFLNPFNQTKTLKNYLKLYKEKTKK